VWCNTVREKPQPKPKNANRARGISDSRAERPTPLSVPVPQLCPQSFPSVTFAIDSRIELSFQLRFSVGPGFSFLVAKGRGKKESQLQPLPPFLLALRQFKTAKVLNVRLLLFIFKSFLSWGFFLAAKCQTAAKVRVQNGVPSGRGWGRGRQLTRVQFSKIFL